MIYWIINNTFQSVTYGNTPNSSQYGGNHTCENPAGSIYWYSFQGGEMDYLLIWIDVFGLQLSIDLVCLSQASHNNSDFLCSPSTTQKLNIFHHFSAGLTYILLHLRIITSHPMWNNQPLLVKFIVDINAEISSITFLITL